MERPILNPSIFDDPDRQPDAPQRDVGGAIRRGLRAVFLTFPRWTIRTIVRLLLMKVHPTFRRHDEADALHRGIIARLLAPMIFRLTCLALMVLGTVGGLVYLMTHPIASVDGRMAPVCPGVVAEPVNIQAADGVVVRAWHLPALDAKQVLRHKELAARAKWPAVVLVPDQRGDRHELDRLIRPLHERGYVILLLELRGLDGKAAQTFGLLEHQEVLAAVHYLRGRSYVDRERISVIGSGTGATAALLAGQRDAGIARVWAYAPVLDFDAVLAEYVNAPWLRPACRWAFETLQQVDVSAIGIAALSPPSTGRVQLLQTRPTSNDFQALLAGLHRLPATLAQND